MFYFIFSVGGKDKGTRFLTFVDAINGFRHLLVQEDLDRALSLCTGLKGQLKNKFIVLSDDRILPPYQGNKGKRSHPDDEANPTSVKRQHHEHGQNVVPVIQLLPGVSPIVHPPGPALSAQPFQGIHNINAIANTGFPPPLAPAHLIQGGPSNVAFTHSNFPPLSAPAHLMVYNQAQGQSQSPVTHVSPASTQMLVQAMIHGPGPSQNTCAPTSQVVAQTTSQSHVNVSPPDGVQAATFNTVVQSARPVHGYVTVKNQKSGRVRGKKKGGEANPSRLTPSRLAKEKTKSQSAPMDITSPAENYESCDESTASVEDDQDIIKTAP